MTAASDLRGRRVAVTGAAGFLGRPLCAALAERGARVRALVRRGAGTAPLAAFGAEIHRDRLGDRAALVATLRGCETVVHLAHDFRAPAERTLAELRALADACEAAGVARLLLASSIAVYDGWPGADLDEGSLRSDSGSAYKRAKHAMERELGERAAAGRLLGVALQPTIVLGAGSWQWSERFARRLARGPVLLPDDGSGICNWVDVEDVVEAFLSAATAVSPGPRYVVTSPEPVSWRTLYEAHRRALGRGEIRSVAAPVVATDGADAAGSVRRLRAAVTGVVARAVGDARLRALARRLGPRRFDPKRLQWPSREELALYRGTGRCSSELARRELGWVARVSLAQSVARTAPWFAELVG